MTVRIDPKKLKEERDLSYLAGWYCPVEKTRVVGNALEADGRAQRISLSRFTHSLMFGKIQLSGAQKQAMAGF